MRWNLLHMPMTRNVLLSLCVGVGDSNETLDAANSFVGTLGQSLDE